MISFRNLMKLRTNIHFVKRQHQGWMRNNKNWCITKAVYPVRLALSTFISKNKDQNRKHNTLSFMMTKLSRDTLYSEGRRHQSLKKLLMVWLTIFNVYIYIITKSLMWRMMICFHKFEYKLIDIQNMFCCVYFQKADWKHLIWKIKDYSTAILLA